MALDGEQLDRFRADGYLPLGAVMSAGELQSLSRRTDDLTTGRVPPGRVGFQLDKKWHHAGYDSTGYAYAGASDGYRKIGGLEWDSGLLPGDHRAGDARCDPPARPAAARHPPGDDPE